MQEVVYNEALKKLRLNEENLLRNTDLQIQKSHAEEEAKVRKELDKKHMNEQIELRTILSEKQAELRMQLIGESLNDAEAELEKKSLERFEQMKKTE